MKEKGAVLWFTGLPSSGKTTITRFVATELNRRGERVEQLDGDALRADLAQDLGYTREDRFTHLKRAGSIAELLAKHGVIVLASFITPYQRMRDYLRERISTYVEVYVKCSLRECVRRDVKGLYQRALKGEIPHFTGVSDPFEEPLQPDLVLNTEQETPEESVARVMEWMKERGMLFYSSKGGER